MKVFYLIKTNRIQNKIDRIQNNPTKVAKTNTKQNILNDIKTAKQNKIDGTVIRTTVTSTGTAGEIFNSVVDLDDKDKVKNNGKKTWIRINTKSNRKTKEERCYMSIMNLIVPVPFIQLYKKLEQH